MLDPAIVGKVHQEGAQTLTMSANVWIGIWDCRQISSCGCAGNISCTGPETVETVGKFHHAGSCDCRQSSSRGCRKPNSVGKFKDRDLGLSANFIMRVRRQHQLADLCDRNSAQRGILLTFVDRSSAQRGNLLTFVDRSSAQRSAETC